MKLRYTDKSKDDIELAFAWYERQRKGLGFEFLDCVEASLQNIINNPAPVLGLHWAALGLTTVTCC